MNRRDNLMAALDCRQPEDYVPLWELGFHCWDQLGYGTMALGEAFAGLTSAEQEKALHTNAEIMVKGAEELHFTAVSVPTGFWYQAPGDLAYYVLPGETRFEQARILREKAPEDLVLVSNCGGVMGMPGADNYVDFSLKLFDAPEEIDQDAEELLELGLNNVRRMAEAGVEVVYTASDIADNHGVFFNPEQLERFIYPYLDRWSEEVKKLGLRALMHTDGNITNCLEGLAETAVEGIQAIDPVAGMDIVKVKEQAAGRLCLCGNVDCGILLSGSEEDVYTATRSLLESCKAGGGLICGASNAVVNSTPIVNYRAMVKAWEEYGTY